MKPSPGQGWRGLGWRGLGWLGVFPLVGALMLIAAIAVGVAQQRFRVHAVQAQGTVIDHRVSHSDSSESGSGGSDTYCPIVRFAVDGREIEFVGKVCSSPPSNDVGDPVVVLYRPGEPDDARLDSFAERWLAILVLGGMGSVFVAIGVLVAAAPGLRMHTGGGGGGGLQRTGIAIQAEVVEVAQDPTGAVDGRTPWRIRAQWRDPASGEVHPFDSPALWSDPSEFVGAHIEVRIKPGQPSRYWMDTGFPPRTAS